MKKLSVCIPTFGEPYNLERCVNSVRSCTEYEDYELLIIDDGTNSLTTSRYINNSADRYWILDDNIGNAGVRARLVNEADGYYIAQLDSDIIVTPGWATKLIHTLEHGMEGDDRASIQIAAALLACQIGYFLSVEKPMNDFGLIQVETVGNACTMYRKSLFEMIGSFDADLGNLWSDMDFGKRLAARADLFLELDPSVTNGLTPKVVIDPGVMAYHHGWTDSDGIMREDEGKNTRSLPELNTVEQKLRQLGSMNIILDRWGVKHDQMDELRDELTKAGAI